jgi:ketosteroid isomerase-like protein
MNEAALQRLIDESELRDLISALPRYLDARDFDGSGDLFLEDAVEEIGPHVRRGRAEIIAGPKGDLEPLYELTYHHMGQIYVDVDGDEASMVAYCTAYHLPKASNVSEHSDVGGRYHVKATRTEDGWRIAHLRLELILVSGLPFFALSGAEDNN